MGSLKQLAKRGLLRFGYRLERLPTTTMGRFHPDVQAGLTVKDAPFYARWSKPYPLFCGWIGDPEFRRAYEGVERHTLVSPDRCYMLFALALHASQLEGHFAECGVYQGGTALLLARTLASASVEKDLFLFDSFEGLPASSPADNYYKGGEFSSTSAEAVASLLSPFKFAQVRKGWIPETFKGLEDQHFAFVHVDVDLYQPALDCCSFFWPRLVRGGILLFDEYGFPSARGEKDAVDEWCAGRTEKPISLISGQGLLLKP
jgi:hypothetical protein